MSVKHTVIKTAYKSVKPILFTQDAEKVHNRASNLGESIANITILGSLLDNVISYSNKSLNQTICNIDFTNPIGLAAGFDYDGHLAGLMHSCGFGFNTVGTVTAKSYEGNKGIRLDRLPKSKSLFVNKGFKSEGIDSVIKRLDTKPLDDITYGMSIGSTNIKSINTINKAIDDYVISFSKAKEKTNIKYFELNISCPNASMSESFGTKENFRLLLQEINKLKIQKPIFVKMANEMTLNNVDILVNLGISKGMSGFILSNLVKDRNNAGLDREELEKFRNMKGNFSGKPTYNNSNRLINHIYKVYGKDTTIIGCGGVFNSNDAYEKIKSGASLIQLISGMIYEGPQIAGEISQGLANLLLQDGFSNIQDAIGINHK